MRGVRFALITSIVLVGAGCGGGSDTFFGGGNTEVRGIATQDSTIDRGDATVVAVNFEFDSNDVFNDKGEVFLVVHLPRGLRFRDGSSEIDGLGGDDEDVGAQILNCPAGDTYLLFQMNRFDLDNASAPLGGSDAQLTLTVDAVGRGESLVIEGAADESRVLYGCNQDFRLDDQDVVTVR